MSPKPNGLQVEFVYEPNTAKGKLLHSVIAEEYREMVSDKGLSEAYKEQMIQVVAELVQYFIDLACKTDPASPACGELEGKQDKDSGDLLSSDQTNPTQPDESSAKR